MRPPSLTSSESFRLRMQRSDQGRAVIMAGVYGAMILLTVERRLTRGVVMSDDRVFIPYMAVLAVALGYAIFVALALRGAMRRGVVVPLWRPMVNAVFEITVPALLLGILHLWSPRGPYAALSAPALLLFPITVLLSVLRLRPITTLWLGLAAALFHAILAMATIRAEKLGPEQYAVLLSYAVLLAVTGFAGMFLTRAVRRYVVEAIEETEARERAGQRLAAMERDLEVARQIQMGLLPAGPPSFPGFDIAGMNRPAEQTGGDYYDWQELPDGRLLIAMADVTGHGVGPALVMAVCRAYARASAPLDGDPVSLMSRLNALLHADITGGRFVTLAMAVLERDGGAQLVSAGHGPSALYRSADRKVELFGGDGLPLAILADESYGPPRRFAMQRGDVLVLLTDGVIEWLSPRGVQFGHDRLAAAIAESATLPAAQIIERIDRAVLGHAEGSPQADDVTVVVIKRTA